MLMDEELKFCAHPVAVTLDMSSEGRVSQRQMRGTVSTVFASLIIPLRKSNNTFLLLHIISIKKKQEVAVTFSSLRST